MADRTERAVKSQLAALPAREYDIGIRRKQPDGKSQMIRRRWSKADIMKALPWLKRENALGADIYIRPHDERHILLDGISPAKIAELKRDGLRPAAVVESAPGQFQAWVTLDSNPVDESYSKNIAHQLAESTGTNPDAANPEHLGRLAGFTNRSPHFRRGDHFPYTLVHDAKPQVAPNGSALIRKERELAGDTPEQIQARLAKLFREAEAARARTDKTRVAVEQHLDALPAAAYQITVSHTKDGQLQTEHFHGSREQFMGSLEWLKKQHAQGAHITMRPLDSRYALAHNLNKDEVDYYQTSGLPPSIVVETAPGKYQAWIKLSDEPIEPEISQRVTDRFAEVYGAPDPANFGQLAGLGEAKIRDCQPQTAPLGAELIELLRKNIAKGPQQPDRTKAAVINQLNALPAESYEIAIRRREGGPMIRHTWRRGKIIGSLSSQLKKENVAGADIFIRPIDTRYVLVHNISPAKIDEFKESGFPPSATVETAPGEFQAWIKLTDSPIEEDLSEWIAKELAKYGATPEGHYPSNLGRLAGFTNHEAPIQPSNPAPYVLIHEHQPELAPNGQKAVDYQRKQMAKAMAPKGTATSQQRSYSPWRQPPQGPIVQTPGRFTAGFDPKVLSAFGPKPPQTPPQEEEEEKEKRKDGPSPSMGMGR